MAGSLLRNVKDWSGGGDNGAGLRIGSCGTGIIVDGSAVVKIEMGR